MQVTAPIPSVASLIEKWILCTVTVREEVIPGIKLLPTSLSIEHHKAEHFLDATSSQRVEHPANAAELHCTIRTSVYTFCYPQGEAHETFCQRLAECLDNHIAATGQAAPCQVRDTGCNSCPEQASACGQEPAGVYLAVKNLLNAYHPSGSRSWWLPLGLAPHDPQAKYHFISAVKTNSSPADVQVAAADRFLAFRHLDGNVHATDLEGRTLLLHPSAVSGCLAVTVRAVPRAARGVAFDMLVREQDLEAAVTYLARATKHARFSQGYGLLTMRKMNNFDSLPLGARGALAARKPGGIE